MDNVFEIRDGVLISYNGKGGDVVIPDGVVEINNWAFFGCYGLRSINIPDGVKKIGKRAFADCSDLTSVNIPNSVKVIEWRAFAGCSNLTSVNIPDSVTEIGNSAFEGCRSLTSINIPDSVTEIGYCTFYGCRKLTSIYIPNSVKMIGMCAFKYTNIKRHPQRNVAYKGFCVDMTCRDFQYEEGKTYECDQAELCVCGFHACLNPLDCFNYYADNCVYHEVILEDRTGETHIDDSKICGKKITIGRRLTIKEMVDIFNELNK